MIKQTILIEKPLKKPLLERIEYRIIVGKDRDKRSYYTMGLIIRDEKGEIEAWSRILHLTECFKSIQLMQKHFLLVQSAFLLDSINVEDLPTLKNQKIKLEDII